MVYKSLGLSLILAVILFLVVAVVPMLLIPIVLYVLILVGLAGLVLVLIGGDRVSQWQLYRRHILRSAVQVWVFLTSGPFLFAHAVLIIVAPGLMLIAATLPYLTSLMVVFQVVAASHRHSHSLSSGDVSNLAGALAVVVAVFAISLTMLPMYIPLMKNAFDWLRVTQSRHLKGKFTFGREELSYEIATWRLFIQAHEIKSRGCARKVLDRLRAGTQEGYKYVHAGSAVAMDFFPPKKVGLSDGLCYAFYLVMYKPRYLEKAPWGERSWWHLFASLNTLVGVFVLFIYGLLLHTLAVKGLSDLIASFVGIYFPE